MSGFWLGDQPPDPPALTFQQFVDDLAGRGDILRALDIGEPRFRKWLERAERIEIPRPLKRIGHTDVWSMTEWKTWYGRWITRHDPDKGWRNTKRHGEGESFFTYWR